MHLPDNLQRPEKVQVAETTPCVVCGKPLRRNGKAYAIWFNNKQAAANGGGGLLHIKCYTPPSRAAREALEAKPEPAMDPQDWPLGEPTE